MNEHSDQDSTATLGLSPSAETTVTPDPATTAVMPDAAVPPRATGYGAAPQTAASERPTVRWGALVWGLLFGLTAAVTLWILIDPGRRNAIDDWFLALNPLAATLYALVAVGAIVVLFGIVGLIRRGERARR